METKRTERGILGKKKCEKMKKKIMKIVFRLVLKKTIDNDNLENFGIFGLKF